MREGALASVWDPLPAGSVAIWALIGVVAVVIIVRLRDDEFGFGFAAALTAIAAAGLVLLCASVRGQARYDEDVVIRSAHGQVSVPGFQDAISRESGGGQDRHR